MLEYCNHIWILDQPEDPIMDQFLLLENQTVNESECMMQGREIWDSNPCEM